MDRSEGEVPPRMCNRSSVAWLGRSFFGAIKVTDGSKSEKKNAYKKKKEMKGRTKNHLEGKSVRRGYL